MSTSQASEMLADPSMQQRIEALPYLNATGSRDYGRGYARAVRDVLELLWSHDRHWLTEPCGCDPEVVAGQIQRTPLPASQGSPT